MLSIGFILRLLFVAFTLHYTNFITFFIHLSDVLYLLRVS